MKKKFTLFVALAVTSMLVGAQQPKSDAKRSVDTPEAKFLKKCIRNMTKEACNAPPEARVHK